MTSRRRWMLDALRMAGGLITGLALIALVTTLITPGVDARPPSPAPATQSFSR